MTNAGDAADSPRVLIACSLGAAELQTRLSQWQELLRRVSDRQPIEGGLRLVFLRSAPGDAIADLTVREHACCPFLDFTVDLEAEEPVVDVRGPAAAQPIIREVFGGAA
jgi:hypothetical protein